MVAINAKSALPTGHGRMHETKLGAFILILLAAAFWFYGGPVITRDYESTLPAPLPEPPAPIRQVDESPPVDTSTVQHPQCPVTSIASLSKAEIEPKAGLRHMVDPPAGGKLTLVCCETTKGHFSALLHHSWAPMGVARLVEMIQSNYFSSKIPFFRCTDACQFGLSGDPEETKKFNAPLQDDPAWLPPGKDFRQNELGIKRYPPGMWTYAGSGPNSRSNQFVITLKPNPFMGGGSPWEVPLGEFVGKESFGILPKIFNGYGEKGPGQNLLRAEGNSERVQNEWPLMDYILGCSVVDEL